MINKSKRYFVVTKKIRQRNINIFTCANQSIVIFQILHHSQCQAIQSRRSNMCESANDVIVETAIINDLDPDTISVVASGHRPHVNIY